MTTKERITEFNSMLGDDLVSAKFLDWLVNDRKYFEAPASKGHHGAYRGGLYEHSNAVASELIHLTHKLGLVWQRPESPSVVGYLHDICKTDDYMLVNEGLKGPTYTVQSESIDYNPDKLMPGHGDKSVLMLAGHFELTEEEAACIQFHMGAFTDKEQWQYYTAAVKRFPNVLYTHLADMIASQIRGI